MADVFKGRQLPAGWRVYETEDGRPYFHAAVPNKTQWEEPVAPAISLDPASSTVGFEDGTGDIADGNSRTTVVGYGKVGRTYATISGAIDVEGGVRASTNGGGAGSLFFGLLDVTPLQAYYDVTTEIVKSRLISTILPWRVVIDASRVARDFSLAADVSLDSVTSSIRESPDFYGPFWICTTLMFVLFFSSNAAIYLSGGGSHKLAKYDAMVVAFFTTYGYLFTVPMLGVLLVIGIGGSSERENVRLVPLLSVYGYSFAVAIPLAALNTLPSPLIKWLSAMVGSGVTLLFLCFNYKTEVLESSYWFRVFFVALFAVAQLSFYAFFPLYYFNV